MDVSAMRKQQERAYDLMNEYNKILDNECTSKSGEGTTQIIQKNAKIDVVKIFLFL